MLNGLVIGKGGLRLRRAVGGITRRGRESLFAQKMWEGHGNEMKVSVAKRTESVGGCRMGVYVHRWK